MTLTALQGNNVDWGLQKPFFGTQMSKVICSIPSLICKIVKISQTLTHYIISCVLHNRVHPVGF